MNLHRAFAAGMQAAAGGGQTLVFRDTFTDADNTLLSNHAPDLNDLAGTPAWIVDNEIVFGKTGDGRIDGNIFTNLALNGGENTRALINVGTDRYRYKFRVRGTDSFGKAHLKSNTLATSGIELIIHPSAVYVRQRPDNTTLFDFTGIAGPGETWYAVDADVDGETVVVTVTNETTLATETSPLLTAVVNLGPQYNYVGAEMDNISGNAPGFDDVEVYI